MYYGQKDMIRKNVIPVLLGNTASAHLLSFRIYFKCGITSYICDDKRTILDFLDATSRFFKLGERNEKRVLLDALDYLASNKDYLPILIPCNEYYASLTEEFRDFFEARFIISDSASFFSQKPISIL